MRGELEQLQDRGTVEEYRAFAAELRDRWCDPRDRPHTVSVLRLTVAGPETTILSTLCERCPHSPAGCCVAPPRLDLSDVGRIVSLGGRDWLLEQLAEGRIVRVGDQRWLSIVRRGEPRRCGYHGEKGCTIPHDRRPATCNFYVCEEAIGDDAHARALSTDLVNRFVAWDEELERRALARDAHYCFDAAFLDWLGAAFRSLG